MKLLPTVSLGYLTPNQYGFWIDHVTPKLTVVGMGRRSLIVERARRRFSAGPAIYTIFGLVSGYLLQLGFG